MVEETNSEQSAAGSSAAPTIADLAGSIEVPAVVKSVEQGGSPNEQTPDNVEDFKNHYAEKLKSLQAQVDDNTTRTKEFTEAEGRKAVKQEISSAAEAINKSVGGNSELAELYLENAYNNNPDLQKIWDNRANNPKALEAALDILGKEWGAVQGNTIDPQIAENQRALKESQRGGDAVQAESETAKFNSMPDGEFMHKMRSIAKSG